MFLTREYNLVRVSHKKGRSSQTLQSPKLIEIFEISWISGISGISGTSEQSEVITKVHKNFEQHLTINITERGFHFIDNP